MAERTVPARDTAPEPDGPGTTAGAPPGDAGPPELLHRPDPQAVTSAAQFAEALARLREQAGVGVRDLAREAGVTSSTLSAWLTGRRLPPLGAVEALDRMLGACRVPAGPARAAWIDALTRVRRNPGQRPADVPAAYRGLESYRVQDAPYFAGRERLVARLVAAVTTAPRGGPPTVLAGPPGCGKSSALHAGLLARLRAAGSWEVVTLTPGEHPLASLDAALDDLRARKLLPGARVALVVDQFEELFTLGAPDDERREFARRLVEPLGPGLARSADGGPVVTVVLGLRADFYGHALALGALAPALQDHQVVAGPPAPDDLRRAVTDPARAAGVQVEPALVELLLHDAATGTPDGTPALPLLSFALYRTWDRGLHRRLTVEDYAAVRGLPGAVADAAEAVHDRLAPAQREVARQLFGRLVVLGEGGPDVPRRLTATQLGLDTPAGDATSEVLERFVEARLLTVRDSGSGDSTVELAHAALLTAWPRLQGWLDGERAARVTHRRLAAAAADWERDGRDPGLLHRGDALAEALRCTAEPHRAAELTTTQRQFLATSQAARDREASRGRRRVRRLQALVAGACALGVVAAGTAAVTARDRSSAQDDGAQALSRRLAEAAGGVRGTDPALAAQVALLAWRTAPTAQARSAVLDSSAAPLAARVTGPGGATAVAASGDGRTLAAAGELGGLRVWRVAPAGPAGTEAAPPAVTLLGDVPRADERPLHAVVVTRDGGLVAAAGASGVIHLWDTSSGSLSALPDVALGRGTVLGLATSADGRTLAATTTDGHVVLYDLKGARPAMLGTPLAAPVGGLVQAVAFSADDRSLAAAGSTGRVQVWSLADRAHPAAGPLLAGPAGGVTALAFSPDGRRLAAAGRDQAVSLWSQVVAGAAPARLAGAPGPVTGVAFSPDGALLAAGADRAVRVYETTSRAVVADLPHPAGVTGLTYLADGRTLVTAAADGSLRLWAAPTTAALPAGRTASLGYLDGGRLVTVSGGVPGPDGLRVLDVSGRHAARSLGAVGVPAAAPAGRAPAAAAAARPAWSGALAVPAAGSLVAAGTTASSVWLLEAAAVQGGSGTRTLGVLPRAGTGAVRALALSADGRRLAIGSDDGSLLLADVSAPATPRVVGRPATAPGTPAALAFSPDGRRLAVAAPGPGSVSLWDVADGGLTQATAPVASGGPSAGVSALAWAPDGRTLAAGSADRSVRLLDVADPGRPAWLADTLGRAGDAVTGVAYDRSGHRLAATGEDGSTRVWDVTDRSAPALQALLDAPTGTATRTSVAFDPSGARLAVAGPDAPTVQWDLDPAAAAARICLLAGAPADPADWSRRLPDVPYRNPCG